MIISFKIPLFRKIISSIKIYFDVDRGSDLTKDAVIQSLQAQIDQANKDEIDGYCHFPFGYPEAIETLSLVSESDWDFVGVEINTPESKIRVSGTSIFFMTPHGREEICIQQIEPIRIESNGELSETEN